MDKDKFAESSSRHEWKTLRWHIFGGIFGNVRFPASTAIELSTLLHLKFRVIRLTEYDKIAEVDSNEWTTCAIYSPIAKYTFSNTRQMVVEFNPTFPSRAIRSLDLPRTRKCFDVYITCILTIFQAHFCTRYIYLYGVYIVITGHRRFLVSWERSFSNFQDVLF